jgi:hypothetical protein
MLVPSDKMVEALENVRQDCGNFPEFKDFDHLIALLQMAFCEHVFVAQRVGGPPDDAGSNEVVSVCSKCGMEEPGE